MTFVTKSAARERFAGKRVAIVGSGPGCLQNRPGLIDSHDVVVRVNNYGIFPGRTGTRTDVFYSFFGHSIRKQAERLKKDGVTLCMCKCPNDQVIESAWHRERRQMHGVDFRPIYQRREGWWFCDTYIPTTADFMRNFHLLDGHIPTTGFAAILDIFEFEPSSIYLTGFDFFRSGIHNVTQTWRKNNPTDPIGHRPEAELAWLKANIGRFPITFDNVLTDLLTPVAA